MIESRNKNVTSASDSTQSPPVERQPHTTQSLGSEIYGLPVLRIQETSRRDAQTVEDEFDTYNTAQCSDAGVDKLAFWKVRVLFLSSYTCCR
jgi:hypothetical protein